MEQSAPLTLNALDRKKIGKWALIALVWALLTYLVQLIPTIDFGVYTPMVVAGMSILVNFVNKWIAGQK